MDEHDRLGGLGDRTPSARQASPHGHTQSECRPAPRPGQGYLAYTYYRRILDQNMTQATAALAGLVLDLGGERHSRRGTFRPPQRPGLNWVCVNTDPSVAPDVIADAAHGPFADQCTDAIICTEVLEHVTDPAAVIADASRLLKPGGALALSMPFIGYVHADPYDFQRYTAQKLELLLRDAGFRDITIHTMGYYYAVLCEMIKGALARLRPNVLRWLLAAAMIPIMNWLVNRELNPHYEPSAYMRGYTLGHFVEAHKK